MIGWSDSHCELVEGCAEAVAVRDVGGEFVVAAAQILDERMPGGDDPREVVAFESAHWPQPGLQPPMIGFDRVIGVTLGGVQRGGDQLIKDPAGKQGRGRW
jgi:hypothetical protein